jgi:hypothetical protein
MKITQPCFVFGNRPQQGFALVMVLVFMVLVFAAAAALFNTRQMWAFASQKQLDSTLMDIASTSDAKAWNLSLRDAVQAAGEIDLTQEFSIGNPSIVSSGSAYNQKISGLGDFPPKAAYPAHGLAEDTYPLPVLIPITPFNELESVRYGSKDHYYGAPSIVWGAGAHFEREMDDTVYDLREGRFSAVTTKLRAWQSIDGALPSRLVARSMPVSAFTYFVGRSSEAGSTVTVGTSDSESGLNFIRLNSSYSMGDFRGMAGCGRIYVDGALNVNSTQEIFRVGLPLVATDGLTEGSVLQFAFPRHLGGGASPVLEVSSDFRRTNHATTRGLYLSNYDTPARFLSPTAVRDGSRWVNGSLLSVIEAIAVVEPEYIVINVNNASVGVQPVEGEIYTPFSGFADAFRVDTDAKTILVSPFPGFFADGFSPLMRVKVIGTDAEQYVIRISVPSVADLFVTGTGNPPFTGYKGFTFVSTNPVVLMGGLNGLSRNLPAMIISPEVRVERWPTFENNFQVNGVIVTESGSAEAPIRYYGDDSGLVESPSLDIVGSLVVWRHTSVVPGGIPVPLTLQPSLVYLQGSALPIGVPAVTDVQLLTEGFWTFKPSAVTPEDQDDVIEFEEGQDSN